MKEAAENESNSYLDVYYMSTEYITLWVDIIFSNTAQLLLRVFYWGMVMTFV